MNPFASLFPLERYGLQARLVDEDDAAFIIALRTDPHLSRFIHPTSPDMEAQKAWIRAYKEREAQGSEFYFLFSMFTDEGGLEPLGLARLYHIDYEKKTYTFGSWVFKPQIPVHCSMAGAMIAREVAFYDLGMELELEVDGIHSDNKGVYSFSKTLGMEFDGIREDALGQFHTGRLSRVSFEKHKDKIYRFIPADLR